MSYLLDTNILLRLSDTASPHNEPVKAVILSLREKGETLYITPQNIIEFWAVATRPVSANGLGFSHEVAREEVRRFKEVFALAPDIPAVFDNWERWVQRFEVSGKQVHDTRLVAVMTAHPIPRLLTFNTEDFRRFSSLGLSFVRPESILKETG